MVRDVLNTTRKSRLLIALLFLVVPISACSSKDAQASDRLQSCNHSLADAHVMLTKDTNVSVKSIVFEPDNDAANPYRDSYTIKFVVQNPTVKTEHSESIREVSRSFMGSFAKQSRIVKKIEQGCPSVSVISFGLDYSGYIIRYYRAPSDKQFYPGRQVECSASRVPLPWGTYMSC